MAWSIYKRDDPKGITLTDWTNLFSHVVIEYGMKEAYGFEALPTVARLKMKNDMSDGGGLARGFQLRITDGSFSFDCVSKRMEAVQTPDPQESGLWVICVGLDDALRGSFVNPPRSGWDAISLSDLAHDLFLQARFVVFPRQGNATYPNHWVLVAGDEAVPPAQAPFILFDKTQYFEIVNASGRGNSIYYAGDRWGNEAVTVWDALSELAMFAYGRLTYSGNKIKFLTGRERLKLHSVPTVTLFGHYGGTLIQTPYVTNVRVKASPRYLLPFGEVYRQEGLSIPAFQTIRIKKSFRDEAGNPLAVWDVQPVTGLAIEDIWRFRERTGNITARGGVTARLLKITREGFEAEITNTRPFRVFVDFSLEGTALKQGDAVFYEVVDGAGVNKSGITRRQYELGYYPQDENYLRLWAEWRLYQFKMLEAAGTVGGSVTYKNPSVIYDVGDAIDPFALTAGWTGGYSIIGLRIEINSQKETFVTYYLEPHLRTFQAGDSTDLDLVQGFGLAAEVLHLIGDVAP